MSSAVSYAANVGSPPGFSGWANQVEPAVAQPLGRRQMRPIGDGLVWPTPAWSWMRLLAAGQTRTTFNDARSANLKARALHSGKAKSNSQLSRAQFEARRTEVPCQARFHGPRIGVVLS